MNKIEKIQNYAKTEFSKEKFLESCFFVKSEFKEIIFYPNFKKHFIFLYLIYLVGYAALLRANITYMDDNPRSYIGYAGWENYSRYLSNFFSHFLHMGWNLLDQSPINQLIAIGILSLSSIFITQVFFKREEITYFKLFASIPIGLSPFYLQNMAFKFDSTYMSLAVLASIFPFLFLKNKLAFYIVGILSLLTTLTSYQAGHQIFIEISIFLILKAYLENKTKQEIKDLAIKFFTVFFIALLIFKIFLFKELAGNRHTAISLLMPHEIPVESFNNLKRYFYYGIYDCFKGTFFLYLIIIALGLFLVNVAIRYKNIKKLALSFALLFLAAISTLGLFTLLHNTFLVPRNFNGFNAFLVGILFLLFIISDKYLKLINKALIFFLCYNCLVIANIFGNAIKIQNDYNDYRIRSVINTLNIDSNDEIIKKNFDFEKTKMYIKYTKGGLVPPLLHNNLKHMPILEALIIEKLRGGINLQYTFMEFYKFNNIKFSDKYGAILGVSMSIWNCSKISKENIEIIKSSDTLLHKLTYYSNNCIELEFK